MRTSQVLRRGQTSVVDIDTADSDGGVYNRGLGCHVNQQSVAGDTDTVFDPLARDGLGDPAEDV